MHSIFVEAGAKGMAVSGAIVAANFPSDSLDFLTAQNSLELRRFDKLDMLVVSKLRSGFDRDCVDNLSLLLRKIASGELSKLKYVVFDFAHRGDDQSHAADGFDDLVSATSELILSAPVITIAWARSFMSGADLDFALACSGMVAEREARFSFETDLASSIGLYSSLARKIGWVKTERLMDHGSVLDADEMMALLLTKKVADENTGMTGIEQYVSQCSRRYNASYSMAFRAQRITMPLAIRGPRPVGMKGFPDSRNVVEWNVAVGRQRAGHRRLRRARGRRACFWAQRHGERPSPTQAISATVRRKLRHARSRSPVAGCVTRFWCKRLRRGIIVAPDVGRAHDVVH